MDKKIKVLMVSAIITLYPLSINNSASAGFYDWMVSKETVFTTTVGFASMGNSANSFDKFFGWTKNENKIAPSELLASFINEPANIESEIKIVRTYTVRATAYSSTHDQTDSTPFITAKGTYVRDGIIAANFLPFGTKIRIPDLYGDKIFTVEDRMNARYWYNIDIWFPERSLAKAFGSQRITIEIVEES